MKNKREHYTRPHVTAICCMACDKALLAGSGELEMKYGGRLDSEGNILEFHYSTVNPDDIDAKEGGDWDTGYDVWK